MVIKKSDLYSSLWASCDALRGGMDASQYKDYVLFMLFIKYITDKYAARRDKLSEADVKRLVIDSKWMARLHADVQCELDRISQTLTGRIRELAERYATPLPQLTDEVEALARRVDGHLTRMDFAWN